MAQIPPLILVVFASTAVAAPPRYCLTELSTDAGQSSWARVVHDDGRVAGARTVATDTTVQTHGVVWRESGESAYIPFIFTNHAWATALGPDDTVFGHSRISTLTGRPFASWVSSTEFSPTIFSYLPQYFWSVTLGVSNQSIGVGYLYPTPVQIIGNQIHRRAFVVPVDGNLNTPVIVPTLGGWSNWATALNDLGTVVGGSFTTSGPLTAFRWSPAGGTVSLGTLGGSSSEANDINNAGQIVGWSMDATNARRAFLYENGSMHDLGTLGGAHAEASAINSGGDIVGQSWTADGAVAFVHTEGVMHNLNHRTAGLSEDSWVLARAEDINAHGVIVGWATRLENGGRVTRAFRLDPVCPADWDADGAFSFFDLQAYIQDFAAHHPGTDLSGDGVLNFFDVAALLEAAGECQGPVVRAD
jgi:probable HAF family extracellular repeat protein